MSVWLVSPAVVWLGGGPMLSGVGLGRSNHISLADELRYAGISHGTWHEGRPVSRTPFDASR